MTNHSDLLKKIRRQLDSEDCDMVDILDMLEKSADTIETLLKQVEWSIEQRDLYQRQREAAGAEVARLLEVLENIRAHAKEGWVWIGGKESFRAIVDMIDAALEAKHD